MRLNIREQLLSEQRTAALLKHVMPERNVMTWLRTDRAGSPILPSVVHRGAPHYYATEVFRFAQGIAKDPAAPYLMALEMGLDRRTGNERRFGERRRRAPDVFADPAAGTDRRSRQERRAQA
jgi:hypothetical protein